MTTPPIRIGTAATATLRASGTIVDLLLLRVGEGGATAWVRTDADGGERAEANFEATRTGWHEAWAVRGGERGTAAVVIAWRSDALGRPAVREGVRLAWLEAGPAGPGQRRIHAARELALESCGSRAVESNTRGRWGETGETRSRTVL